MRLAQLLKFHYCFECVDSLNRKQFFDFYYPLDFLQGGRQRYWIRKLQSLDKSFGEILSNSDLEYFACQNDEFIEVLMSILTPASLSIDFQEFELLFTQDIRLNIKKICSNFRKA